MCMNYLEFKRRLMVDPYLQDPSFVAAKEQDEQFAAAAKESQDFERILQTALNVEVPPGLAEQIILRTSIEEGLSAPPAAATARAARTPWPQALAAGIFAAAVTAGVMSWGFAGRGHDAGLETFVVHHWELDGRKALEAARSKYSSKEESRQILASSGMVADDELLERIRFSKNCPTPEGVGAHLIVNTEHGPITLFVIPGMNGDIEQMSFGDVIAVLLNEQNGAAAVLGEDETSVREVQELVKGKLHPMSTST